MMMTLQSEIRRILDENQIVKNACRKEFLGLYIPALVQSNSVQFCQTAKFLNADVKIKSNMTRIQDFYREVEINYDFVAVLLLTLLPKNKKLRISIDRTEWDFGKTQINILMILVGHGDFQIPFYWEMLENNSGNSNSGDRINLLEKVFKIIDKKRIGLVVADREFIGHQWLKWMKNQGLSFCVRVPKSHYIHRLNGEKLRAEDLAKLFPDGTYLLDCMVDNVWGNVYIKSLPDGDILFLFGNCQAKFLAQLYQKRWSIEVFFQNIKTRGFNLEDTHVRELQRIRKLIAMVSIAYAFCVSLGIYANRKIKKIKINIDNYKVNSFFRTGMNMIFENFRKPELIEQNLTPIFKIFTRLIVRKLQIFKYQILVV
jgi:Transposase DDE domain